MMIGRSQSASHARNLRQVKTQRLTATVFVDVPRSSGIKSACCTRVCFRQFHARLIVVIVLPLFRSKTHHGDRQKSLVVVSVLKSNANQVERATPDNERRLDEYIDFGFEGDDQNSAKNNAS